MKSNVLRASIALAVTLVAGASIGLASCGVAVGADKASGESSIADSRWWSPGDERLFPPFVEYRNEHGAVRTLNMGGALETKNHPFFTPIGTNGRACVTCHQPSDGMSLSAATAKARWTSTHGTDPLFAAIDGSNCPHLPQAEASSHSLLLERGLIRVFRPWPPKDGQGRIIDPQFTLEVVRDPTGCNTHPQYGLKSKAPTISVYRRPRPVTNTKYLTAVGFSFEPKNGLPLPRDPETGAMLSGNLMADSRAATLKAQAIDAAHVHLQADKRPSDSVLNEIVEFEKRLFTAQSQDRWGGPLDGGGASGGPETLQRSLEGDLQYGGSPIWKEFLPWAKATTTTAGLSAQDAESQRKFRESVARGAEIFTKRTFLVWDAAGITNMGFGNPVRNACAFCHNMQRTGMDVAPGQVDLGTTNEPAADSSPELPLFKVTCKDKFPPHPHYGRVIYTQDPGFALTTGKCIDVGKITIQQMRGLSARAPYFSNGSAKTLRDIVEFYDRRYKINFTESEKQDLTNLMSVL